MRIKIVGLTFQGIHQQILEDETPELDIEGGRMSGKTWLCCAKVLRSCQRYPGIWWLVNRYSGTETDNQLRPQLTLVARMLGIELTWDSEESAYHLPEVDGKISKIFAYGLKTQSRDQRYAKIRGSGVGGLYNDQSEEMPEDIATEMRALLRQPSYPHQLIFSPNPPDEEHFLADQFPDDVDPPGRKYYRLSLYDNRHNLPPETIERLEKAYPPTHAKYKSLILGQRGPNVTGRPVYEGAFDRSLHVAARRYDPSVELLEAFDAGKHHPTWLAAQRSPFGGLHILGGVIGKRLFLEDFLPAVDRYRWEWFNTSKAMTCCDPPPRAELGLRYTPVHLLRESGLTPRWRENGNGPDVRVAVIENIGGMMHRRAGTDQAFLVSADPTRFLMVSHAVTKQSKLFVDGLEGSYVWDENYVSVGNKTVRQPRFDQWLDGWQRCLENLLLNFCAGQATSEEVERRRAKQRQRELEAGNPYEGEGPNAWMGR